MSTRTNSISFILGLGLSKIVKVIPSNARINTISHAIPITVGCNIEEIIIDCFNEISSSFFKTAGVV
ncbi:unknown [Clostridium sp. CAG:967]|nr:unknown [Clostridium sp. CAG:967]